MRFARSLTSLLAALLLTLVVAPIARGDDSGTVTVVGTSDVADSGLVANVLKPGFEARFPQYHLNYVSKGTGVAIGLAEDGTASGLLVHAASLENQFVDQGFSQEQFGRALFYGDYVLLGPANDPAGVMANAPNDIATAFERIAAAGEAGHANFVSRGGTPGTTVQEHIIWALTHGVSLCNVSQPNGGGEVPSGTTGNCPSTPDQPAWYQTTNQTQAPNILTGDTCNFTGGGCYVFTDRGTFNFLQSQSQAQNLHVVTRNNAADKRGGSTILINSFHAYVINPDKFAGDPNVHINVPGATAFLDYVTSPQGQAATRQWLSENGDPPFLPDAAPALTGALPSVVTGGTPVTLSGSLRNVVPGTPALNGAPVSVSTAHGNLGSATTDANGNYAFSFTPLASASYTVSSGPMTRIEDATLNPIFGDLLQPTSSSAGSMSVQSSLSIGSITRAFHQIVVNGSVLPGTGHVAGAVSLAVRKGTSGAFTPATTSRLSTTQSSFSIPLSMAAGKYQVQARFDDPGTVLGTIHPAVTVTVPGHASLSISKLKVRKGRLTLTARFTRPQTSGGHLQLFGRQGKKITKAKAKQSASAKLKRIGKRVAVFPGDSRMTLHAKLRRGHKWQLQLRYTHPNEIDPAASRVRTVRVR